MNFITGYEIAEKIMLKTQGCKNERERAEALGIEVLTYDLGNLKSMYSSADRHRTIYVNKKLCGPEYEFVMDHEIGHDQIPAHRRMARNSPMREIQFFGEDYMRNWTEHEANIIAAHLYIDEEELKDYLLYEKRDIFSVSSLLKAPLDLTLIKLQEMVRADRIDQRFKNIDIPADFRFLRKTGFGEDEDYDNIP